MLFKSHPLLVSSSGCTLSPSSLNPTQRPAGSLGAGQIGVVALPASPPVLHLLPLPPTPFFSSSSFFFFLSSARRLPSPPLSSSVYLLSPADANAGLVKKGGGLTPALWANITPQQVCRRRGSGRGGRAGSWAAGSPAFGAAGP